VTAKRADRAAEAGGTASATAARDRAALITARKLVPLPPSPLPDKLHAAIDGTGVPVTSKETARRDGKGEVKLAVFFTQDKADHEGYPVRGRGFSSYVAAFGPRWPGLLSSCSATSAANGSPPASAPTCPGRFWRPRTGVP
jgi:hypothetical protein